MSQHIEYWAFEKNKLLEAIKHHFKDNAAAKEVVLAFLYGASAEQYKLFHTNEDIGPKS